MSKHIALFGATGRTGKEFLKFALAEGYTVKALARDPAKVIAQSELLTIVKGDFENHSALKQVVQGADYVVCMAAADMTATAGSYPKNFMLHFVQRLYAIMEETAQPKLFLYQAGSMSIDGKGYLHPVAWAMKHTLGRKLQIFPKISDNDAAIRYIGENSDRLKFIVTRAGVLKDGSMEKDAKLSNWPPLPWSPITYADLAACTLRALEDESIHNTFPFVVSI